MHYVNVQPQQIKGIKTREKILVFFHNFLFFNLFLEIFQILIFYCSGFSENSKHCSELIYMKNQNVPVDSFVECKLQITQPICSVLVKFYYLSLLYGIMKGAFHKQCLNCVLSFELTHYITESENHTWLISKFALSCKLVSSPG